MGTYDTLTALRDGILEQLDDVGDLGVLLTHYEPVKDKREFLEVYLAEVAGDAELRGVLVTPSAQGMHQPSIEAVVGDVYAGGYTVLDTWRWDVTVFRGAEHDPDLREDALRRGAAVFDMLRGTLAYGSVGLHQAPSVTWGAHGWGKVANVGCWITELTAELTVPADVSY